jgi:hypothetical protein
MARQKVRAPEPYQPFPVESLPLPIRRFVSEGARAMGCDPSFLALPTLAAAASAIGNTRTIRLKRGWEEPSVIWSCVVGDSGALKSPAYQQAVAPLFTIQRRLAADHRDQMEARCGESTRPTVGQRLTSYKGPKQRLPRVITSDVSLAKVVEILHDSPRGVLLARDELAGWLGSFARNKSQQASDLPSWLEMHRAGCVIVDRKVRKQPTVCVPRAALSVTGGIQPGVLARVMTQAFQDAGLAARFLLAWPPRMPKRWSEDEIDLDVEWDWEILLKTLRGLQFDETSPEDHRPRVLELSQEAHQVWVAFYNEWGAEQAAVTGELASAFAKLEGYAARLALLHHVVVHADCKPDHRGYIGPESVEAGVKLCRWFAAEARRVYTILSESKEEREARALVECIQSRGGRITVRELMRANCRRWPTAESAESALSGLVAGGLARWVDPETDMKGGRPIKVVLLVTHDTDDSGDTISSGNAAATW